MNPPVLPTRSKHPRCVVCGTRKDTRKHGWRWYLCKEHENWYHTIMLGEHG